MNKAGRTIFHIDLDAFFASCEERENPRFRGNPIVVGADPHSPDGEGRGRGVVSTANYIAREYGVHSAMPISQAYRLCPSAIFLPVNGALYNRVSNSVMDILENFARKYNGKFEQASVDEAYLDLSQYLYPCTSARIHKQVKGAAGKIKKKIYQQEKITASIGIGPNMLIAKIASDFQKPDGLTVVEGKETQRFLDPLPIRKLPGIGPKTEDELKKLYVGYRKPHIIQTVRDLRELPQSLLYDNFGQHGISIYESAQGIDHAEVGEESETKSIGAEHTFQKDTASAQEILPVLFSLVKNVLETARNEGYKNFKTITVKIRYEDFKTHTKSRSADYPLFDIKQIERTALTLFWPFLNGQRKIRLLGFRINKFM